MSPVFDALGPRGVGQAAGRSERFCLGVVIESLSIMFRQKQAKSEIQAKKIARDLVSYVFRVLIGNSLSFVYSVESGILGGLTSVFWCDYPRWALCVSRIL